MPTYDYLCHACSYRFEKFHSITAEPIRICPVCNESEVTRLVTGGAGLIFKGSGFYITDYKNSKTSSVSSNGAKNQKKEKPASTKTNDTKKE